MAMAEFNEDSQYNVDNEDDELTTAADVIQKFEEVWVNEKLSPELLIYEGELIECLLDQVQHMDSSLQKVSKEDFRIVFHKMELDRIRYLISSYLRIRLEKIERFGFHVLDQESQSQGDPSLMSDEEKLFAHKYTSSIKEYLHKEALNKMPLNMQTLKFEEVGCKPQMDKSVFIKVKKDCRGITLEDFSEYGDEEIVDLNAGSQHILRYKPISRLLKDGLVQLI